MHVHVVELTFHATVIMSSILLILTFCGTLGTIDLDKTKVILIVLLPYKHTFAIISRSFKNTISSTSTIDSSNTDSIVNGVI